MSDSLAGQTLSGRYFLRELIGQGGMAEVYLAWDTLRSTKMAVKILRQKQSRKSLSMFEQEAKLLRQLEHPNIARLYEFDADGDINFLVMDWIEGSDLRKAIGERHRPFAAKDVAPILLPVCSALSYAHQNEVFHCDVKPANILLHKDGRVLLTDFGVARLAQDDAIGGTPAYMAPEQIVSNETDARTDIYALGITLYEMVTGGRLPFRGESADSIGSTTKERIFWEHVNRPAPSPKRYNRNLSSDVEAVIMRALSKTPRERFATAMALGEAFEQARGPDEVTDGTIWEKMTSLSIPDIRLPQPSKITPPFSLPPESLPSRSIIERPSQVEQPSLFGRQGTFRGYSVVVPPGGLTIGRSASNQLHLPERTVSRRHATIVRTKRGIYIQDEGSSLGTYVNNVQVNGTVALRHGDIIRIGYSEEFEFRIE